MLEELETREDLKKMVSGGSGGGGGGVSGVMEKLGLGAEQKPVQNGEKK